MSYSNAQYATYSGVASNVNGILMLCSNVSSGGSYLLKNDIAPNFQLLYQAKVPSWSSNSLQMSFISDQQTFKLQCPSSNIINLTDVNNFVLQSNVLSNTLSNNAFNNFEIVSISSNLFVGVNGIGYQFFVPNWQTASNWSDGAFQWSASNSSGVSGCNAVQNIFCQSTLDVSDPARFNGPVVVADALNALRIGAGSVLTPTVTCSNVYSSNLSGLLAYSNLTGVPAQTSNFNVLTASNIQASNLGNLAFSNTIPYSLITGAPAVTSNFNVLTASNLQASNLGALAFQSTISYSNLLGVPNVTSNFSTITASNIGIGTSNPIYPLDVTGQGRFTSNIVFTGTGGAPTAGTYGGAGDRVILATGSSSNAPYSIGYVNNELWASTSSNGHIAFYSGGTCVSQIGSNTWLTGSLGINTVGQAYNLDVHGTGRFTTSLYANALSITSTAVIPTMSSTTTTTTTLIASNISASNLGSLAFSSTVPWSQVTGAPGTTSNYSTLSATNETIVTSTMSNLTTSNLTSTNLYAPNVTSSTVFSSNVYAQQYLNVGPSNPGPFSLLNLNSANSNCLIQFNNLPKSKISKG